MTQTDERPDQAVDLHLLMYGSFTAQLVRAFAQLGIADALADGPLTEAGLATAIGADPAALRSYLRTCTVLGLVAEDADGQYRLTGGAELRRGSFTHQQAIWLLGRGATASYEEIAGVVRTGRSGRDLVGSHLYDYYSHNLEEGNAYEETMSEFTEDCVKSLIDAYDFSGVGHIVDVGGGKATLLSHLLTARPELRGTVYDLPHVIEFARQQMAETQPQQLRDRLEFAPGSFLTDVPAGGDLYIIKNIICDWGDAEVATLLRNCHEAMKPGDRLLLIDRFGPEEAEQAGDPAFAMVDFFIWTILGGRLRSASEVAGVMTECGFTVDTTVLDFGGSTEWSYVAAHR